MRTPLFVGAASKAQAERVRATLVRLELPNRGGVAATERSNPHKQWTAPNGWPPHQVMAVYGLRRYGFDDDAKRIARKWMLDAIAGNSRQDRVW